VTHENGPPEGFRSGFIAIIGRPNVGKSTLLNAVLGQKIAITSHKPQTTRNRILGIHNLPGAQLLFLDTPGIHRARGLLNRYMVDQAVSACQDVDAILLLVEADDPPGGGDDFVLELAARTKAPVILVINKIDLIPRTKLLPLIAAYAEKFDFQAIIPVSALKGEGLQDLLAALVTQLPEGPRYYPEDMITDLPERFIVAEMIREQLLRQVHDEIPFGTAVVVENFTEKPQQQLVVIQATIFVAREAHKKIVLGHGGSKIKAIGQASRHSIQRLLGTRIFLELLVKVEKNWTETERSLKRFGYD
jgi:GTP-binding protein Era